MIIKFKNIRIKTTPLWIKGMVLMGVVGGIGGYYIGSDIEIIVVGIIVGAGVGFVLFKGVDDY